MKAIQIHSFGGPEVLMYQDVPRPTAGTGEVLIRVQAAGVNPAEWKAASGKAKLIREMPLPLTLGWDVSGIVEEVGPDVTAFQQGDAVYGLLRFPSPSAGTYAEYVTAPVADLALKPTSIDHIHAAAVPMAALTAWQGLFEHGKLEAGQTALITGAAGGVGHFAVQLAKSKGAQVIGVASGRHAAFLREMGVDQFIDYTSTSIEDVAHDVDLLLDTVGGRDGDHLLSVLKRGGTLIPVLSRSYSAGRVEEAGITIRTTLANIMQLRSNGAQLVEIGELIDAGQVRVAIDAVVPLAEAARAHERSAAGHVQGKIVLAV
jgi:NADPH:quinone reductase-like Zn-dependent oxidoreductase